jgi:hypothetical protein
MPIHLSSSNIAWPTEPISFKPDIVDLHQIF